MFILFASLGALMFFATPVLLILSIIFTALKKKPVIWWSICGGCFILFFVFELIAYAFSCKHDYKLVEEVAATCTEDGYSKYHCDKCDQDKIENIDKLGHVMKITSRIEPTENLVGEIVRECSRCGYEEVETVPKLEKEEEVSSSEVSSVMESSLPNETSSIQSNSESQESKQESSEESSQESKEEPKSSSNTNDTSSTTPPVTFVEIYYAYKENELRADDVYGDKRYTITAIVNGMSSGGLFNLTGGATLTMQINVDSTIVFFYAEFEKEQEENLKTINVGDTITFEGTCSSYGWWSDCEIISE